MNGVVIQLLGLPGTGKYTIGREIVLQLEASGRPARLTDNHATANLVFDIVPSGERFTPDALGRINDIRQIVRDAIVDLSPPEWSFVFTNFLPATATTRTIEQNRAMAEGRGSTYLCVQLACSDEELLRRVVGPGRAERLKLVDVDRTRQVIVEGQTIPAWTDLHHLDVTELTPPDAAAAVIAMLPS